MGDQPEWARRLENLMTTITTDVGDLRTEVQAVRTEVQTARTELKAELQAVRTDLSNQIHTHACRCPGSAMHNDAVQALANLNVVHVTATDRAVSDLSDAATAVPGHP